MLKQLVWGSLPLKACHNSRTIEIRSPFKETALKVENHALLRMSQYLLMNAQNGCVLVLGQNLSSLGEQGWSKICRSVSQAGFPVGVGQVLGVLVVFYGNYENPRSPVC